MTDAPDTPQQPPTARPKTRKFRRRGAESPALALWVRVLLFLLGWLLVLLGIAGLILPGIQGILTLLIGAAVLSLVSELAYALLRRSLSPWPWTWKRVATWRRKIRQKVVSWTHREPDPPENVSESRDQPRDKPRRDGADGASEAPYRSSNGT